MDVEDAFLRAIRESPDDDTPRLVYADWLTDHGDASDHVRGELIRVQCELARRSPDDPRRDALSQRESALLQAHRLEWLDLAFAEWLRHRKRACRNREGHEFCKVVRQGILARCERDRLAKGEPRRAKLEAKLGTLGERMDEFGFLPATCDVPLFDVATFRRGFVECVVIQDWAVDLFAEALPDLAVLREIEIDNESAEDGLGGRALGRLVSVLDRMPLNVINCHADVNSLGPVRLLADSPAASRLSKLHLWFDEQLNGDEFVAILAASSHLSGLRELSLEHSRNFTDAAFLDVLDSPHLAGLTHCRLRPNDTMPLSAAVIKRFAARFGPQIEQDAVVGE